MAHATRELLLQTHLPQCRQRVDERFAGTLVNAVRKTPRNARAICEHMQNYLLFDRVLLAEVQEVSPSVFEAIQAAWAKTYPERCACTVRALSSSQVEVLCPVNSAAAMVLHRSTAGHLLIWLLMQLLTILTLAYSIHVKFLSPYADWLSSRHSGWYYYLFSPLLCSVSLMGI